MAILNTAKILKDARANRYAVGAFNIENLDMAKAVIEAAEQTKQPVIIQTTYTTVNYGGANALYGLVKGLAEDSRAEICLHLDHGVDYEVCERAIKAGYPSVMIDGSRFALYHNIDLSRRVVDLARSYGAAVEGEIGRVGGVEDDINADILYTDVNECIEFVEKSGVDFVAIGVGTAHGIYEGEPNVNIFRINEIFNAVNIPLVLHGASGLRDDVIKDAIANGISKINYATEMRQSYTEGVREALEDSKVYDPKVYQLAGREKVKHFVLNKMKLFI